MCRACIRGVHSHCMPCTTVVEAGWMERHRASKKSLPNSLFPSLFLFLSIFLCLSLSLFLSPSALPPSFVTREVRWVRRYTRLTIRVTVWGRGSGGSKSQRVAWLRCRTQRGLSPVPERTGKLAPLTPFYSIIVPVVQFFGAIVIFAMTIMARSFTTHLTSSVVHRVQFGPDSRESGPNTGTVLT